MLNKAQISIFIIVSVVIVIVASFLFFISDYSLFYSPSERAGQELKTSVETCVYESAQSGVFILGFQGGYISIPQEIQNDPSRRLVFSQNGSFNSGSFTLPNWDSQLGDIPTIESQEVQLEEFINNNSQNCIISNFEEYDNLELDYSFDNFVVDVSINEQNIEIQLDLPVEFREVNGEIDSQVSSYYVELEDTPLGDLHSLANEIFMVEEQTLLFEELVLDQIYSASGNSDKIASMPSEGITFSCKPQIWRVSELKETLSKLNNQNFKYLYFQGTRPIEDIFQANLGGDLAEYQDYYRSNYEHSLSNVKPSYENYGVEVVMPTSEFTGSTGYFNSYPYRAFEVTPSTGEIVKPMDIDIDVGEFDIPIPCIQIYHHLYTLDYDLLIQLRDYSQDGDEGLLYQFPLRIQIEDNSPKEAPRTSFTPNEPNTATNDQFCSAENRNTQASIYVQDDVSKEYLSNANVTYKCISLSCDLGTTQKQTYGFEDIIRPDSIPLINTTLGYCSGGDLEVEKQGYFQIGQDSKISTGNSQKIPAITALMVPTKDYPISSTNLIATNYQTCDSFSRSSGQFLISIENEGYDFKSQAFYPRASEGYMDKLTLLEKPGVLYNVSVIYMRGDQPYGIMELENIELDPNSGNRIEIDIPVSNSPLNDINAVDYFDDVEALIGNDRICSGIDFGIRVE